MTVAETDTANTPLARPVPVTLNCDAIIAAGVVPPIAGGVVSAVVRSALAIVRTLTV